jgi:hypothetical protein
MPAASVRDSVIGWSGPNTRRHRSSVSSPSARAGSASPPHPRRRPGRLTYEQAVNSPKRELRAFTPEEGATEHIGLDHLPYVSTFIADWVADTFADLELHVVN